MLCMLLALLTLQWCHGVPTHQPLDYLFNFYFQAANEKHQSFALQTLCNGNPPMDIPCKGPAIREAFLGPDAIIYFTLSIILCRFGYIIILDNDRCRVHLSFV